MARFKETKNCNSKFQNRWIVMAYLRSWKIVIAWIQKKTLFIHPSNLDCNWYLQLPLNWIGDPNGCITLLTYYIFQYLIFNTYDSLNLTLNSYTFQNLTSRLWIPSIPVFSQHLTCFLPFSLSLLYLFFFFSGQIDSMGEMSKASTGFFIFGTKQVRGWRGLMVAFF